MNPHTRHEPRPGFGASLLVISMLAVGVAVDLPPSCAAAASGPTATSAVSTGRPASRSPVLWVPRTPDMRAAAVWDTLERLEWAQKWLISDSLATALVEDLEKAARVDSLALSRALLYIANAHTKQRQFADGRGFASLERAVGIRKRNLPSDDLLTIWAHVLAGTFYTEAGNPERARDHAETAVRLLTSSATPDSALLAQAHLGLATSSKALGRMTDAHAAYEAALQIRSAIDGPVDRTLVPMLAEYGLFLSRLGDFDAARGLLRRAVAIAELDSFPRSDFLEGSLSRLSSVENRAGNIGVSLDLAQRAYERARQNVGEGGVQALRMRTIVAYRLLDLGDYRGAARQLREITPALAEATGATNPQTLNVRLALVESLLMANDTTGVASELAAVRAGLEGQQHFANSNTPYIRQLTADYDLTAGRTDAARETLDVAIRGEWEKADPSGGHLAVLYSRRFGIVDGPSGRSDVTRLAAEVERLRDSTSVPLTAEWIELLTTQSKAEARAGMRDAAMTHALAAEQLARERLQFQVQALPDTRALQLAQQSGGPLETLVALAQPNQSEECAIVWDRLVRWRGLVRHEMALRRPAALASTDTAVASAHGRWLEAQQHLAQLVVSGVALPGDPQSAGEFEAAKRVAEVAEQRYARLLGDAVPHVEGVDLEHVIAVLQPDQALVAFATGSVRWGEESLGAFVVTGRDHRVQWVPLGNSNDLRRSVGEWMQSLATPPRNASMAGEEERTCRRLGERVRTRIWAPLAHALGEARVISLVGEGPVTEIPWLALPEGKTYLAEAPLDLRLLGAERDLLPSDLPTTSETGGLLAVGDPAFDSPEPQSDEPTPLLLAVRARQWPCEGTRAVPLPPLPGARAEVEDIAQAWPADAGDVRLLTGEEAGELAFKRASPGRAVIHIATHGVVVVDSCGIELASNPVANSGLARRGVGGVEPIASPPSRPRVEAVKATRPESVPSPANPWLGRQVWLALAGASRPPSESKDENEGLLTAEEVVTLNLRGTDWVVLSACHSGLAPAWAREGVLGMRRAFELAGARSVIASQWPIADESTREWMASLYGARARGASSSGAVSYACRATLEARRSSGRSTHPFYWAAFTAVGP